jgi:flagellar biosynthetic protein FliP
MPPAFTDVSLTPFVAVGLAGLVAALLVWWQRQRLGGRADDAIRLVATRGLGGKRLLALVEVEHERFLLGLTEDAMTCLGRLGMAATSAGDDGGGAEEWALGVGGRPSTGGPGRTPTGGRTARAQGVIVALLTLGALLLPAAAHAALPQLSLEVGGNGGDGVSTSIQLMLLFTLLSFAPAILIGISAFVRIAIVLSFVRQAVGTQQMPPNQIILALALFLTFFVMMPTLQQVNQEAVQPYLHESTPPVEALEKGFQPLRAFMLRQTREKDLALFLGISHHDRPDTPADVPPEIVIPAFMISELKTAFQISFMVYIPFLVLDMVVASILTSMGMITLPPVLISLPFKLMIFVLVDGWNLLISTLIQSFH